MSDTQLAGSFLVATPVVGGLPFDRAVIFILEHGDDGAVGLIINAATDVPVVDHLPDLDATPSTPGTIHIGGPVETDSAILLGRSGTADFVQPTPLGDVGVVDPEELPGDLDHLRVFAGYSGWEGGQLEAELEEGAWWVLPANRDDIFADDTADMWERLVAEAPGTIPFHRTFTRDVSSN